jgi:uncharacterized protein YqeY
VADLKDRLQADLTEAMRGREETAVSALRLALAAITRAEVEGSKHELGDGEVLAVLQAEAKKRREAAEAYDGAGRPELAARERAQEDVLRAYLPAEVSDGVLTEVVREEVARAAAAGLAGGKALGAVIKAVRERLGASVDGGRVAAAAKAALQG